MDVCQCIWLFFFFKEFRWSCMCGKDFDTLNSLTVSSGHIISWLLHCHYMVLPSFVTVDLERGSVFSCPPLCLAFAYIQTYRHAQISPPVTNGWKITSYPVFQSLLESSSFPKDQGICHWSHCVLLYPWGANLNVFPLSNMVAHVPRSTFALSSFPLGGGFIICIKYFLGSSRVDYICT